MTFDRKIRTMVYCVFLSLALAALQAGEWSDAVGFLLAVGLYEFVNFLTDGWPDIRWRNR